MAVTKEREVLVAEGAKRGEAAAESRRKQHLDVVAANTAAHGQSIEYADQQTADDVDGHGGVGEMPHGERVDKTRHSHAQRRTTAPPRATINMERIIYWSFEF